MNSDDIELKQVVHTSNIGWPREFGKLNLSRHPWIFTSVSVDSTPPSAKLFTSSTVRMSARTVPKCGTKPHPLCDTPLSRPTRHSFAPWQKSRGNHRSYAWTEVLSGMIFRRGAKAIRYRANITFNNKIITGLFYLQIFLHLSTLFTLINSLNQ